MTGLYGFKPDRPDFCGDGHLCDSRLMKAAPSSLPSRFVIERGENVVQTDQDCTANAIGAALRDRQILQGTVAPKLLSRRRLYLLSRLYEIAVRLGIGGTTAEMVRGALDAVAAGRAVLLDDGAVPEYVMIVANDLGICAEEWWPYTGSPLDTSGPLEAERHAYDQRGKLKLHPWHAAEEAKIALYGLNGKGGAPCTVGGYIDQAYEQTPSGLWVYSGAPVGGHMREIIGWDDAIGGFIEASTWPDGTPRITAYADICNDEITQARYAHDWVPSFSEDNPLAGSVNHALRALPRGPGGRSRRGLPSEPAAAPRGRGLPRCVRARGAGRLARRGDDAGGGELRRVALLVAGLVGATLLPRARGGRPRLGSLSLMHCSQLGDG